MANPDHADVAGARRRRRPAPERSARRARDPRRSRWRWIVLVGGTVLAGYYGMVLAGLDGHDATAVPLAGMAGGADEATVERLTVQVEATELDPGTGSFDIRLRPLPRGPFAEPGRGELTAPLRLEVVSPREPPVSFDFPARQLVDAVGASVEASTVARGFPFDRPQVDFRLEATSGDRVVPLDVEMVDQTEGWALGGSVARDRGGLDVRLDAEREMLSVSFALLSITGIVVVALITVAVIGGAIARGQVDLDQVIWSGAMLVAIPAVRNVMPGAPPVGTAVDLFVLLPSVVIVALALLASIVVLAINKAVSSDAATPPAAATAERD